MTFSIVARCSKTLALGAAVSTAVPAVGSVVPHVEVGVGAIATQALTSIQYGVEGLKLLRKGLAPQTALKTMLHTDRDREKRQVIIIDVKGRTAAFTGSENDEWKGHLIGRDCAAAGNTLTGSDVEKAMIAAFEEATGTLAERLLQALEAGQRAGGDKRGRMSAALLVAGEKGLSETRPVLDLRVDAHPNPVAELRRIYRVSLDYFQVSE